MTPPSIPRSAPLFLASSRLERPRRTATRRPLLGLLAGILVAFSGCESTPYQGPVGSIDVQVDPLGTTFVHLFEWTWSDIADECEAFLGPKGYAAVQISPPNEHIDHDTWWARYQPVSYQLDSRGGTRAELVDMIERCDAVGVEIYADLVINHTASLDGGGVGVAGTRWQVKSHPSNPAYDSSHYHPSCGVDDYTNASNVQRCELVGLPDLDTGQPAVQDQIAAYINDLQDIGVSGFRIDAAKHMAPEDISAILAKAGNPFIFLEVIGARGEAVQPEEYVSMGRSTEFAYGAAVADRMRTHIRDIHRIARIDDSLLASESAVVFINNHDNQRGHGGGGDVMTFKDGDRHTLANVFMLAWPYGYPKVMSSYEFDNSDIGPPAAGGCDSPGWICEHRTTAIANMVEFRRATVGEGVDNWFDNANNQIAFSRGARGFVALNKQDSEMSEVLQTGLPAGVYCNIISGDYSAPDTCTGTTVTVDATGAAKVQVGAFQALAIHVDAVIGGDQ